MLLKETKMLNHHSVPRTTGRFLVAELAQRAEVTPATVRYYSRIGLLDPGREAENGYRCFSTKDLHRIEFIRRAQTLGLTIGDIKSILDSQSNGEIPCGQVKSMVKNRLAIIRERISDLQTTAALITKAMSVWNQSGEPNPRDGEICPLIEGLETNIND
jgi:DNA-binding transcriptional MerR regulator